MFKRVYSNKYIHICLCFVNNITPIILAIQHYSNPQASVAYVSRTDPINYITKRSGQVVNLWFIMYNKP